MSSRPAGRIINPFLVALWSTRCVVWAIVVVVWAILFIICVSRLYFSFALFPSRLVVLNSQLCVSFVLTGLASRTSPG